MTNLHLRPVKVQKLQMQMGFGRVQQLSALMATCISSILATIFPKNGKQVIIHATSQDRVGTHFTKSAEPINIVSDAANRATFEEIDFRDPYVLYNEDEKCYWMLVGTRLAKGPHWTRGCLALLTSKDLKEWSLEPEPFYAPNDMMCPECLELFSLPNGKWYLVYSRFSAPNAGTVYRVSDSPRGPFRNPRDGSGGRLDGRRWYAAKSCQKANDASKRIFFGWIADQVRIWEHLPHCFRPQSVLTNVKKGCRWEMVLGW